MALGIFLSVAVVAVYAGWQDDVTGGSSTLKADDWNNLKDKVIELDNKQLQCVIVRRYENDATPVSIVSFTGANPGVVDAIAVKSTASPPFASFTAFGFNCIESNGWIMTGCAHFVSANADNDFFMSNNGCYGDCEDGSDNNNNIDMTCCRFK